MPRRKPRDARYLGDLSPSARFRALEDCLLQFHKDRLLRKFDAIGVGVGFRERAGSIDETLEPCLVVSVRKKAQVKASSLLPRWVSCTDPRYGRVAVRTDVVNAGAVTLQSNLVESPSVKAGSSRGSILGVARLGDERFMLTAGHVLEKRTHGTRISWSKDSLGGNGECHQALVYLATFNPVEEKVGALDLGIVPITEAGPLSKWQMYPMGNAVLPWEDAFMNPDAVICGQSGTVPVRLARSMVTGHSDLFIDGRPHYRCLLFEFKDSRTKAGDSGGAVITAGGALVGIHLGIWQDKETKTRYSLCQCAGDILSMGRGLFGEDFEIVTKSS